MAQYQSALNTALLNVPGLCGYYWRKTFCNRGHPSVNIVALLGNGFETAAAAEAAVQLLYRELEGMFCTMTVVVTHSERSFWSRRAEMTTQYSRPFQISGTFPPPSPPV
jgi:hypothetical protein